MSQDKVLNFIREKTGLEPREYQARIIDKVIDSFKVANHKSVLLESPTGSGKSLMGLIICKFLEDEMGLSVGWVAMRTKLLGQAEKENKKIGVKNIKFVSMFDKNPPKCDLMVTDECLPASSRVICLVNNEPMIITIGDVMCGIGTHVLSADSFGLIFQPITSRVDMGIRELIEVVTDSGTILITENGRIFTEDGYIMVSDLVPGASCCQTYNKERGTTYEPRKISGNPSRKTKESATLCVRVWPEGTVELARSLLSEVLVQSPSEKNTKYNINTTSGTNNQRNNFATQNSIPTYNTKSMVQIHTLPSISTEGKIISIRRTAKFVNTYDIGVANTHNFFANGILVHNCQHDSADTCISMHGKMGAEFALGLTATPYRTDKVKLVYEKIITDCGVRFLVEAGYLSNFDQYVIKDWSPQIVGQTFLAEQERWGKSIFYFKNAQLCFELEKILKDAGVPCAVLLGSLGTAVKDKIYSDFEDGTIKALINVYLLTEGFDAPDLKTVWVRDSSKLPTVQMSGRVLRKCPEWPDKVANIVQPENTPYPYARTAKPRKQFVWDNDSWKSIEAGPQVERMASVVTRVIMPMQIVLPKFLDTNGTTISITRKSGMNVKNNGIKKSNWWHGGVA
jgi:superfamily II DNA or RNA helicase